MSKLKTASIIGITLGLLLATGSLILVKDRFRPTIVRGWILQAVNEALPGAEVSMNEIQLNFGLNMYVRLSDVSLKTKERSMALFEVHSCVIKLPLWAILTGQGAVEVLVEKPQAYYLGTAQTNNWMMALHPPTFPKPPDLVVGTITSPSDGMQKSGERSQFKFISKILKRLIVNIKMGDLRIAYTLPDNQSGKIHIEKFIVKGLNLDSNTAFELATYVNAGLGKKGRAQFELLAIGQFHLSDVLFNSVIRVKAIAHLKNFLMPQDTLQIPELKAELDLVVDKNNEVHGPILLSFGGSAISTNLRGTTASPDFESLTVDLLIEDIFNVLMLKHEKFAFGTSRVHIDGKVELREKKYSPDLRFGLSTPVMYKNDSMNASISLSGILRDGKYDISSTAEVFGGNVNANLKGTLDVNHLPANLDEYPPFALTLTSNKLLIPKDAVRNLIYSGSDENRNSDQVKKGISKFPHGEISVALQQVMTGVSPMSVEAAISLKGEAIGVRRVVLKYLGDDKGMLTLSSDMQLGTENISGKLKANFQGFNAQGLYPFLPKNLEYATGLFSGKINAKFFTGSRWRYDIATDLTAKNGEIRGINFKDKIIPLLEKWEEVKGKVTAHFPPLDELDQHFDTLELKGNLTDSEYKINKLNFSGGPKRIAVKGNGVMYEQHVSKDGEFFLVLSDIKLKKQFGISALPLRFFGRGLWPKLDFAYTLEKLGVSIK
ncbi:MAG: hypothetical protein A2X86_06050 [Bdellovibrionales bacterium GWA2_49_15]|nr:MAG: hypothetical protein A2X86_06050 [Bdellovibrionales bacterium GWA2_49_15]